MKTRYKICFVLFLSVGFFNISGCGTVGNSNIVGNSGVNTSIETPDPTPTNDKDAAVLVLNGFVSLLAGSSSSPTTAGPDAQGYYIDTRTYSSNN